MNVQVFLCKYVCMRVCINAIIIIAKLFYIHVAALDESWVIKEDLYPIRNTHASFHATPFGNHHRHHKLLL